MGGQIAGDESRGKTERSKKEEIGEREGNQQGAMVGLMPLCLLYV